MGAPAKPAVLVIVGPTASGKTSAALALADAATARGQSIEIVNADSRQVYRGMSIGTAKPTPVEFARVPHHLIDVADPPDGFSLATFLALARASIADIAARSHVPVVVGGTGQYVWGLVEGWQAPEVAPQPEIRQRLESEAEASGSEALFARLTSLDPNAAAFIDARNIRRVVRALEVIELTGIPFSLQRTKGDPGFTTSLFGLTIPRAVLHERIAQRIEAMVDAGWVEEVRALLVSGSRPELPAFSSAGYREIAEYLAGNLTLDEAKDATRAATNRLARSQANWFGAADERISWRDTPEQLVEAALGESQSRRQP
jgi:tRNA dimethylallyltransferase